MSGESNWGKCASAPGPRGKDTDRRDRNVQVTLQILTAMVEKSPRDLPLYSRHVLTILDSVLRSKDINMIEESVTTFETFCRYVDQSSLAADQNLARQYLSIVETYASFASTGFLSNPKISKSPPLVFRWRTASLKAIKSVVGSEAISADSGQQLQLVMPVTLDNLYLDEDDILASLQQKAQTSEKIDFENARKRRMSVATVNTLDTVETDPATAAGTTADADKLARDEVRVLAVRCLRQIFAAGTSSNRGQIRLATVITLKFIASRNPPELPIASFRPSLPGTRNGNWATSLIEAIARWTPVQDRFIIVLTAMEILVRSPIVEAQLDRQLILATMIDWLLSSPINLIGLSVMDVLLGFVRHTLRLLQLGGRDDSAVVPQYQQPTALDLFRDAKETFNPGATLAETDRGRAQVSKETTPSPIRQELLLRLQKCIADLATHVYYTDQITDMMTAILARLKPTPQSETVTAIEDPSAAAKALAASTKLQEDPTTDGFFSFATARVTALRAIKDILVISNYRKTSSGTSVEARSRVGMQVWEGTQWLLRDEDREVRAAYVDALLTWLKLETNKNDLLLPKESPRKSKNLKKQATDGENVALAKRAISNASRKDPRLAKSTFLQLLHLAVFDNALESPENESDVLLLHLLLSNSIERLGVNAVRTGLPMILKLQESALNSNSISSPEGTVNVATLVHAYLWAICEKFDFESSKVGSEINNEISRRKRFGLWLEKLRFPALAIEQIPSATTTEKPPPVSDEILGSMKPFLNNSELVDEIAASYDNSLVSPTSSPPSSPGRVFSVPTLGFGYGYGVALGPRPSPEDQLPQHVKDEMLAGWTRDACIALVEKQSMKTSSITGSRTGASTGPRHLAVNGMVTEGTVSGRESPNVVQSDGNGAVNTYGTAGGLSALQKLRRLSTNDGSPAPLSVSSSRESTIRVTELKQTLLGHPPSLRHPSPLRRPLSRRSESFRSEGSESLMAYSGTDGQEFLGPMEDQMESPIAEVEGRLDTPSPKREESTSRRQSGLNETPTLSRQKSDPRLGDDVPPVPRIPSTLNLPGTFPRDTSPARPEFPTSSTPQIDGRPHTADSHRARTLKADGTGLLSNREGRSMKRGNSRPASRWTSGANPNDMTISNISKVDLGKLLAGIKTKGGEDDAADASEERLVHGISKPPY